MLARRSIQKLIDGSASYLSPQKTDRLVRHLNRNDRLSVDAEWELIVLAALASIGTVQHEPDLGGTSRLDVRFRSSFMNFVADVTALSDEIVERENRVRHLSQELLKWQGQLSKEGIHGGFQFRVGAIDACVRKGLYKTKLVLPAQQEFRQYVFDQKFDEFISAIRHAPSQVRHHIVNNSRACVSMVFTPGARGQASMHPPYKVAHDIEHNIVYQALHSKSAQIKRAGARDPDELAGIILCDGGCDLMRGMPTVGGVSLEAIVGAFLRKSHTVTFVCVVDVYQASWGPGSQGPGFEARS